MLPPVLPPLAHSVAQERPRSARPRVSGADPRKCCLAPHTTISSDSDLVDARNLRDQILPAQER